MTNVWIDVRTPKQALIASTLYKELEKEGYNVYVTTRDYDYTISNLKRTGVEPIVVGGYGETLKDKLVVELERGLKLVDVVLDINPCVLFSYPSPSAARVAFGLKIKHIVMGDTPHAFAANRLDFPLADVAIFSSIIMDEMISYVLTKFTNVVTYNGVDELLWIKSFKPDRKVLDSLGLEEKKYVIIRPEEAKAHYYPEDKPYVLKLVDIVKEHGYTPVVFPRYKDQLGEAKKKEGVIIPTNAVDGPSLEYFSALVITGGITMAREAALLGTPAIILFPRKLKADNALRERGFPIYQLNRDEALKLVNLILKDPQRYEVDTEPLLSQMESPLPIIIEWIEHLCGKPE